MVGRQMAGKAEEIKIVEKKSLSGFDLSNLC
jgi:hypothetical protein